MFSKIETITEVSYDDEVYNLHIADNHNYFANSMMVSNCHEATAKSLSGIIYKMPQVKFKYFFTGTLKDAKTHELQLRGMCGRVHTTTTTKEMMDNGVISKLKINNVILKYPVSITQNFRKVFKEYDKEIEYIITNEFRNNYIVDTALKLERNVLIIFNYISHGKEIYNKLQEKAKEFNKTIYFIAGEIKPDERERIRLLTNNSEDVILVASSGCFKQGVNLPNLFTVIFTHPFKAKIRTLQTIGRILRKFVGKNTATLIDIVDDLRYKKNINHTYKHFIQRLKIYEGQEFEYDITEHNLYDC